MSIRIFLEKCTPCERIPPVAQKTVVTLVDDLDGGEADETVSFGLDGSTYEIDLSSANAGKLRDALATYVGSARRSGRASGAGAAVVAPRVARATTAPRSALGARAGIECQRARAHSRRHRHPVRQGARLTVICRTLFVTTTCPSRPDFARGARSDRSI